MHGIDELGQAVELKIWDSGREIRKAQYHRLGDPVHDKYSYLARSLGGNANDNKS